MSSADLRTETRRLELYVRVSLYLFLLVEPLALIGTTAGDRPLRLALVLLHTAANLLVCRWSLTPVRSRPLVQRRAAVVALVGWVALSLLVTVLTLRLPLWQSTVPTAVVVGGVSLGCVSAALSHRNFVASGLVTGLTIGGVAFTGAGLQPSDARPVAALTGSLLTAVIGLLALGYTFWLSAWMLRVVAELVEARRRAAQLAVAQERLRIARDLHDLFGRTLAAVALKSELAGELLRRNRSEQAAVEIGAVHALADQTSADVRRVVRGIRATDLATELAGARALLGSAGIRCVVDADGGGQLGPEAAGAFAWVLREAVTNVIRHSQAQECFIAFTDGDPARLVVTNDGATAAGAAGDGTGLVGLRERLAAVDGRLHDRHSGGRFTVEALVPAPRTAAAEVRG